VHINPDDGKNKSIIFLVSNTYLALPSRLVFSD
jgi:hypothetical protein